MMNTIGIARKLDRELPIGLVLPDLESYRQLVHLLYTQDWVSQTEFSYGPPLIRGSEDIERAVFAAQGVLEKFDAYVEHGLRNPETRVKLAELFQQRYLARHPRSEMRDVFFASGQVLQVRFSLIQPCKNPYVDELMLQLQEHPHDPSILKQIEQGRGIDVTHVTGELRIFLHNIKNPRHRKKPAVQHMMSGPLADPLIIELVCSGAIPGYFLGYFKPLVEKIGGRVAWLS